MLDTLTNIGKQRVAAIDLQHTYAQVVIASPLVADGYNQVCLEKILNLENFTELKQSLSQEKFSLLSYVASGSETLVEVIPSNVSKNNLDNYKNDLGINDKVYNYDYFNFNNSAFFCAFPIKDSESTTKTLSQINSNNLISQSDIALTHFYLKVYGAKEHDIPSGILTVGTEHVSLTVIIKNSVVCVGSLKFANYSNSSNSSSSSSSSNNSIDSSDINPKSLLDVVKTLFHEAKAFLPKEIISTNGNNSSLDYDSIVVAGECDESFLADLRAILAHNGGLGIGVGVIELFNPLTYNYVNIDSLGEREKHLLLSEGHKFASVIASAAMTLEFAGVDLSTNKLQLAKTFTKEVYFYTPENYAVKVIELGISAATKVKRAVANQISIVAIALVIALACFTYNYYQANQKLYLLDTSISEEKKALESLKDVKHQYQEYKAKIDIKQNRINTIEEIQTTQLVVPTIVKVLQTAQSPIRDSMKFNVLEINGKSINIIGESTDKFKAVDFFKELSSTGTFVDLNPIYDSKDPLKCTYTLSTVYAGPIQANQIKLPIDTPETAEIPTSISQSQLTKVTNTSTNISTSTNK
jgi:hypothetical protein